jgi:hypothetical protein
MPAAKPKPPQPSINPQYWCKVIATAWQKSAKQFIETGRLLLKAEASLPREAFAALIGRPGEPGKLPFSYHTARRLMAIGEDRRLARIFAHGQKNSLPASWRTLYELTRLSDEQFERALERDQIHSDMERDEATFLREPEFAKDEMPPPPERKAAEAPLTRFVTVTTVDKTERIITPYYSRPATPPETVTHLRLVAPNPIFAAWQAGSDDQREEFLNLARLVRIVPETA